MNYALGISYLLLGLLGLCWRSSLIWILFTWRGSIGKNSLLSRLGIAGLYPLSRILKRNEALGMCPGWNPIGLFSSEVCLHMPRLSTDPCKLFTIPLPCSYFNRNHYSRKWSTRLNISKPFFPWTWPHQTNLTSSHAHKQSYQKKQSYPSWESA